MTLKAKKPEVIKEGKPKFLISGKSGVGKTFFALDFPGIYYIDSEGGAVRKQYIEKLVKNGGVYLGKEEGSQDFNTVIDEIKALTIEKHEYKTLIIDSFSHLYNLAAAKAEEKIGNDFGRDKKEANRPTRQLLRWLENLDMTVVLICHYKDKWERKSGDLTCVGSTFDGFDKMEYILDLWIEAQKEGNKRAFVVKKSRIQSFQEGDRHSLDYDKFADLYGKEVIEKESAPFKLANSEQIEMLHQLMEVVRIEDSIIEKWIRAADVDTLEEMSSDQMEKCIKFLQNKLNALKPKESTKKETKK